MSFYCEIYVSWVSVLSAPTPNTQTEVSMYFYKDDKDGHQYWDSLDCPFPNAGPICSLKECYLILKPHLSFRTPLSRAPLSIH